MRLKDKEYSSKNPIPQKEFDKFVNEVHKLAKKTFGMDDYGQYEPIQIKIIDRTRNDFDHFQTIPYYGDKIGNKELMDKILRKVSINMSCANRQFESFREFLQKSMVFYKGINEK